MAIYLYVKEHLETGLKYFGKTVRADPFKYYGSGKKWRRHCRKHGYKIRTTEVWGFDSQDDCTAFALAFSEQNHIVESEVWANLKPENGLDGWVSGQAFSEEHRRKLSVAHKALGGVSPNKRSRGNTGNPMPDHVKEALRGAHLGKKRPRGPCSICGRSTSLQDMSKHLKVHR